MKLWTLSAQTRGHRERDEKELKPKTESIDETCHNRLNHRTGARTPALAAHLPLLDRSLPSAAREHDPGASQLRRQRVAHCEHRAHQPPRQHPRGRVGDLTHAFVETEHIE